MSQGIQNIPVTKNLWFVNAGTKGDNVVDRRILAACFQYGFISAGQGEKYKNAIRKPERDDIVCVYENRTGYVGIARVLQKAIMIGKFKFEGKTLHNKPLINMGRNGHSLFDNENDPIKSEYAIQLHWYKLNPNPLWIPKDGFGFYAPRLTVTVMENKDTIKALEKHFRIKLI